ncbi:hypothetical protein PHYPSEUDO_001716 [Phytophthora pseudosyringae]|uniref:Uncharacterized protein n=1 Tax=Phytophthora pseudosyringae TaxID=221518 RepID=A0A8T1VVF0_9STRA|nr:hypothetical protein PHYPSEUDO_001716 [Phytophthora pseudosyringae]
MAEPTTGRRLGQDVDAAKVDAAHRIDVRKMGMTATLSFVLVLVGLLVFGLAMDTQLMPPTPEVAIAKRGVLKREVCSPRTRNTSDIEYHSGHRFYSALKDMDPPTPPTFGKTHSMLCDEDARFHAGYSYCLPISGRKDTPFCTAADRSDLLHGHSPKSICYASVLHLLLVEVYEELQATGNTPLILFGSLLGAVRNGSMIPFTEDTDIGFVGRINSREVLQEELRLKGYHMFFRGVWRVCVAPTHPLASRLYDHDMPLTRNFRVPYVDLYQMVNLYNGYWDVEELQSSSGRLLPKDKVVPFSQATINGMPFDTVHDPKFFLTAAYGPKYMTPMARRSFSPANVSVATKEMLKHVDKEKMRTVLQKFTKSP